MPPRPLLTPRFVYRANLVRIVDGDTLHLTVDLGFHATIGIICRLARIDCPEVHGETAAAGEAAKRFTTDWLGAYPLAIQPTGQDNWGRWVCEVWRQSDGGCLSDALLAAGHAVPYVATLLPDAAW